MGGGVVGGENTGMSSSGAPRQTREIMVTHKERRLQNSGDEIRCTIKRKGWKKKGTETLDCKVTQGKRVTKNTMEFIHFDDKKCELEGRGLRWQCLKRGEAPSIVGGFKGEGGKTQPSYLFERKIKFFYFEIPHKMIVAQRGVSWRGGTKGQDLRR